MACIAFCVVVDAMLQHPHFSRSGSWPICMYVNVTTQKITSAFLMLVGDKLSNVLIR